MNIKDITMKVLLTIPAILYGMYLVFLKPIICWLLVRDMFQPVLKLWFMQKKIEE